MNNNLQWTAYVMGVLSVISVDLVLLGVVCLWEWFKKFET